MPLEIVRNDITTMKVDAIVNAANSSLERGGGVCGAIFAAAGDAELAMECRAIGHLPVGKAVMTKGYNLPAKNIIHTVGPVWQGGNKNEESLLRSAYRSSLHLALVNGLESVAFPLLSSGAFGYPKDKALQTAIAAIGEFLLEYELMVYLVVFDKKAFTLSEKLFRSIKAYITDSYAERRRTTYGNTTKSRQFEVYDQLMEYESELKEVMAPSPGLEDLINHMDLSFSQMLLKLIDSSGRTDPEVYKRANLDRRHFGKIRNNPDYKPSKNTALALAVALELNLDQTADLLKRAGLALSPSRKFDLIVKYFINEGNYNIFQINEALFFFDETALGG
jgi:O-acetyl-ADP-ribose deacetylase (regulator of RNase III)